MSVLMGAARIDENGKSYGGTAGDQTGKEVMTQAWYSYPWDYMAIHPLESVREKHAACCEAACANDNIGYDQYQRNTLHAQAKDVNFDYSKITASCECDCSSLQNSLCVASGANASYANNGWTTSTMLSPLINAGYIIIAKSTSISGYSGLSTTQKKSVIVGSKYLLKAAYCVRGAIYVKYAGHTVCGLTNGANYKDTLEAAKISSESLSERKASESATSYLKSLTGTYTVTASALNIRNGAGTGKKILVTIPKGTQVKNYGYYSTFSGTKWLYIQFTYNSIKFTGFASSSYLQKT